MSILGPDIPDNIDPRWVGLIDAEQSGWYLNQSDELFRGFHITANDSVLDVGCGTGQATLFCARRGAHVAFTDIKASTVDEVEAKVRDLGTARGYEAIVCDSDPLLVADESASRVVCQEMLEHVADPSRVLAELARVGKPGALYLITVPGEQGEKIQQQIAPPAYFQHPNHIHIFSKDAFVKLVEDAGLVLESYSGFGFFWVFLLSIQWAVEAARGQDFNDEPSSVHSPLNPPFDDSLQNWSTLWRKLTSTGEGLALKHQLDALCPKNQVILARKPL